MKAHRARVYFRSYLPDEVRPASVFNEELEAKWRDEASMDFAHDLHSKWEELNLAEPSQTAVEAALKHLHPRRFVVVDKITWLDDGL